MDVKRIWGSNLYIEDTGNNHEYSVMVIEEFTDVSGRTTHRSVAKTTVPVNSYDFWETIAKIARSLSDVWKDADKVANTIYIAIKEQKADAAV